MRDKPLGAYRKNNQKPGQGYRAPQNNAPLKIKSALKVKRKRVIFKKPLPDGIGMRVNP